MTDKEQIKCKYKFQDKEKFDGKTYCTCFCELCEDLPPCDDNCQIYEDFKQLTLKTQECEQIQEKYEALKLENEEGYEIVDELKHECEELKKANLHIDTNRQCKGKKLKRIEELISACGTGYTDEVMQKIYGIIQEPEPTINDYSITDRYRKALEDIEKYINNQGIDNKWNMRIQKFRSGILDIIRRAKGEE